NLDQTTEPTKRRIPRRGLDINNPHITSVLEMLTRDRLITLGDDSIELAHEALVRHWPRLRDWITKDRDSLRTQHQLTEATAAWESLDRDPEALYRGSRLARAQEWAANSGSALTRQERDFLHASLAAVATEHTAARRRTRRLRQLVALATALLV